MKIKHSVSSSPNKVWWNFFHKKPLDGATNFFEQIYGGMFYIGTKNQIIQEGRGINVLMFKRFQRLSQVSFPLIDLDLGY